MLQLTVGDYKYLDLCPIFNWKPTFGHSRKLQFQQLAEVCRYEKIGYGKATIYRVLEVYSKQKVTKKS